MAVRAATDSQLAHARRRARFEGAVDRSLQASSRVQRTRHVEVARREYRRASSALEDARTMARRVQARQPTVFDRPLAPPGFALPALGDAAGRIRTARRELREARPRLERLERIEARRIREHRRRMAIEAPPLDAPLWQVRRFFRRAAEGYGSSAVILDEIACRESQYDRHAVNDYDNNAAAGDPSKGMFQFIDRTFNLYAPRARDEHPELWRHLGPLNRMDWRQQALTTAWADSQGLLSVDWSSYDDAVFNLYPGEGSDPCRLHFPSRRPR